MFPCKSSTMAKFCANISFIFAECPFIERYGLAKNAGFKAVESGFPYGLNQEDVIKAKNESGLQQVLLNVFTGDVTKGELGFAALPGQENEFRGSITRTVNLAKQLNVQKIHVMSGKVNNPNVPNSDNDETYYSNLKYAADIFQKENILGVIEPINNYSIPNYYMNSYVKALNVVKRINSPNLKIMLDIFHMQQICGNISNTVHELIDYTGHVQIAQVPARNEPDTEGEINYEYILKVLKEKGYTDWIGLEYKPSSSNFKWINDFGYSL